MSQKKHQMDKDYIIFQEDGLFGAKDQKGKVIIPPQYMEMQPFFPNRLKKIKTYLIEEFTTSTNCVQLNVKCNPQNNQLYFIYGCNIGQVKLSHNNCNIYFINNL